MKSALPSKKQHALLEYIDGFISQNNYAPSYREVMRALDYKSVSTVAKHIEGLIERGWLIKRDNSARSVEVVYKEGQGQNKPDVSPTPSLSDTQHEAWLQARIDTFLNTETESTTPEDTVTIIKALQLLKLDELARRYDQSSEEG